jgi:hypothetical protein
METLRLSTSQKVRTDCHGQEGHGRLFYGHMIGYLQSRPDHRRVLCQLKEVVIKETSEESCVQGSFFVCLFVCLCVCFESHEQFFSYLATVTITGDRAVFYVYA